MESKGFKVIVGVLIAAIVMLGGLLAVKTFLTGDEPALTSEGKPVPEGAMEDLVVSQAPSGGYDVATPKDGDAA